MRGAVRLRRGIGVKNELDDAGSIAQVDEDQTSVIAAPMHPARNSGRGAGALGGELAGPRVTVGVRPRRLFHWMTGSKSDVRGSRMDEYGNLKSVI